MVREVVREIALLREKSQNATENDKQIALDLVDTLKANAQSCVGMAANMIGVLKNIIAFNDNGKYVVMFNPIIVKQSKPFDTEEGCLSLTGMRKTVRYKEIVVEYQDNNFKKCQKKYLGWTAQIIQHEIDHCFGKII